MTTTPRITVHYTDSPAGSLWAMSRCGRNLNGHPDTQITHDPRQATCKSCIRAAQALGEL